MPQTEDQPTMSPQEIALHLSSMTATAEMFVRQGDTPAAEHLYTQALLLKPGDHQLLLSRSRCRILCGRPEEAIADAEMVLASQPESTRAILCLADAHFSAGNFEMAMVWYTRGERLSDRGEDFRRGMMRCTEIIEEAIASVDIQQLKDHCSKEKKKKQKQGNKLRQSRGALLKPNQAAMPSKDATPSHFANGPRISKGTRLEATPALIAKDAMTRSRHSIADQHLLEDLYDDYVFLKELAADPIIQRAGDGSIIELVDNGVAYLESRRDFWQARNPMGDQKARS